MQTEGFCVKNKKKVAEVWRHIFFINLKYFSYFKCEYDDQNQVCLRNIVNVLKLYWSYKLLITWRIKNLHLLPEVSRLFFSAGIFLPIEKYGSPPIRIIRFFFSKIKICAIFFVFSSKLKLLWGGYQVRSKFWLCLSANPSATHPNFCYFLGIILFNGLHIRKKIPKVVYIFGFFAVKYYPPFEDFFSNECNFFFIGHLLRLKQYVMPLLIIFTPKKIWGSVFLFSSKKFLFSSFIGKLQKNILVVKNRVLGKIIFFQKNIFFGQKTWLPHTALWNWNTLINNERSFYGMMISFFVFLFKAIF